MKLISLFTLLISITAIGQKKVINHTVYNDWKSLKKDQISINGNVVTYEINPHRGDGYLYIYNKNTKTLDSIFKGKKAAFIGNGDYLVYSICLLYTSDAADD